MPEDRKHAPGFVPGQGYTQEDWDEVCDNPPITAEEFAKARPLKEAMPELYAALANRRADRQHPDDQPGPAKVTLRIDQDILDAFQAGGEGWQARINEALRKAMPQRR